MMTGAVGRFGLLVVLALVCVYAAVVLRGPQGIPAFLEKRREIHELQENNATLAREIQQKKDRIQGLKNNPTAQQMEVRKELKLQRPGETTFMLPETPQAPSPVSAPAPSPAQ